MEQYFEYTNNWFESTARKLWESLPPQLRPSKILEIGSYEGASACFIIQFLSHLYPMEVHCIDTWGGGIEVEESANVKIDMNEIEARFRKNTKLAVDIAKNKVDLFIHKGCSDIELAKLYAEGKTGYFDFIYVDGSHQAPDVLADAVLGFRLLKVGGVMAFDDYLWSENLPGGMDLVRSPKLAVDAFTSIYCRKIKFYSAPVDQLYIQKISD